MANNKDKRQPLKQEIRAFRQEFKKDECAVAAWQALGATTGTNAQFILRNLDESDAEAGSGS